MVTSVAEPEPLSAPAMTLPVALQRLTQQRDPQAWEALLLHSGGDIFRISRRILGDAALAEDACQETLLQIRAHAGVFKPPVSQKEAQQAARVWIMRIAANIALRMGRGRIRNQKRELRSSETMNTVDVNCPASNTLRGEQSAILQREVAELPEALREPILLRFYAEMDYPALGQALACSPDAAKKRVQRGIDRLRVRLALLGLALTVGDLISNLSGAASAHAAEATQAMAAAGAVTALNSTQQLAWSALLNSNHAPALSSAVPLGGLSIMAKISLGIAALVLTGSSVVVVQHSIAEEKPPVQPPVAAAAPVSAPVAVAAPAAPEEPWKAAIREKLKKTITFDFDKAPLPDAVGFISVIANVNIVVSPKAAAAKTPITLRVADMETELALKWITKLADLDFDLSNEAVYVAARDEIAADAQAGKAVAAKTKAGNDAQALRDELWKTDITDKLQRKVTFEFQGTPLLDAIGFLRQLTNVTMIVEPKLARENPIVNLKVNDMPMDLAMQWILKLCDAEFELRDKAVYIHKGLGAVEQKAKLLPPPAGTRPAPQEF